MADQSTEDMLLDAAALEGARRVVNERQYGTCAIVPDDSFVGEEAHIRRQQRLHFKPGELDACTMELIKRAKSLLDFWDANVGETVEFPLMIMGDSEYVLEILEEKLNGIRNAVGVLTDL